MSQSLAELIGMRYYVQIWFTNLLRRLVRIFCVRLLMERVDELLRLFLGTGLFPSRGLSTSSLYCLHIATITQFFRVEGTLSSMPKSPVVFFIVVLSCKLCIFVFLIPLVNKANECWQQLLSAVSSPILVVFRVRVTSVLFLAHPLVNVFHGA